MGPIQQRIFGLFIILSVPFFGLSQGMDLGTWNVLNVKYKHSKQLKISYLKTSVENPVFSTLIIKALQQSEAFFMESRWRYWVAF